MNLLSQVTPLPHRETHLTQWANLSSEEPGQGASSCCQARPSSPLELPPTPQSAPWSLSPHVLPIRRLRLREAKAFPRDTQQTKDRTTTRTQASSVSTSLGRKGRGGEGRGQRRRSPAESSRRQQPGHAELYWPSADSLGYRLALWPHPVSPPSQA